MYQISEPSGSLYNSLLIRFFFLIFPVGRLVSNVMLNNFWLVGLIIECSFRKPHDPVIQIPFMVNLSFDEKLNNPSITKRNHVSNFEFVPCINHCVKKAVALIFVRKLVAKMLALSIPCIMNCL